MLGIVDRIFLSRGDVRTVDFTLGLRHAVDMGWVGLTGACLDFRSLGWSPKG